MKRNIIKILSLCAIMLCLPKFASAQYFVTGGIAYEVLSSSEYTVEVSMKQNGYHGNVNIPSSVDYNGSSYDVVALGEEAFYGSTLSNVTIPSSVTQIKSRCFLFANGPTTINVPASVTDIEEEAFGAYYLTAINVDEANPNYRSIDGMLFSKDSATIFECPAAKSGTIILPQNIKRIAASAFARCNQISSVTLPQGLTSIGYWAFIGATSLNNMVIPSSVEDLGVDLFGGCSALTNLTLETGNTHYYLDGMAIYSINGDTLISYHKSADSVFLPSSLRVVYGFSSNSDIRYIHIPDGVNIIGSNAFNSSSLQSVDLPTVMEEIGPYAFAYCESLTHICMPSTLERMGNFAFYFCTRLKSVDIPDSLHTIPNGAFFWCKSLSNITWGNAIELIDTSAFGDCVFKELHFPPTLRTIKMCAFISNVYGKLHKVHFSAPIDTIEVDAFYQQPLETIHFANATPPVNVSITENDIVYNCLDETDLDTIFIPCGSLNTWLADDYWGRFADIYVEDCSSIEELDKDNIKVYSLGGQIVVDGAEGETVLVFDIEGRNISNEALSTGVYLVKVGNRPARKIVITR